MNSIYIVPFTSYQENANHRNTNTSIFTIIKKEFKNNIAYLLYYWQHGKLVQLLETEKQVLLCFMKKNEVNLGVKSHLCNSLVLRLNLSRLHFLIGGKMGKMGIIKMMPVDGLL